MSVLQLNRIGIGQTGVKPGSVKMISTDNLATVTAAGYLNRNGNTLLPSVALQASDVIEALIGYNVSTQVGTLVYFQPTIVNGVITLVSWDNPASEPLPSGEIFVGNGSGVATARAMTGDIAITNTGVTSIQSDAVTTAKILDANVTLAKLASGITPSHVVKFAGQPTTVGGAAAEAFTVTGVAATDLAFVQIVNDGTANVTVLQAVCTLNTLTVTFSGNPGADCVFNYQILRAAT